MVDNYWSYVPSELGVLNPSVLSLIRVKNWWIIVEIIDTRAITNELNINCVCDCDNYSLRKDYVVVPKNSNSIVVRCSDCEKHILRITGLVNREWTMQVPAEFL
jgi:hypothetical protein